jgi:hypothetical protein
LLITVIIPCGAAHHDSYFRVPRRFKHTRIRHSGGGAEVRWGSTPDLG